MNSNENNSKHKDLTEFLLNAVRKRTAMYLMDNDLRSLKKFLTGYVVARGQNSIKTSDRFLDKFESWFFANRNKSEYTMWYPAILSECNNSEERALTMFWDYLEKFSKDIELEQ